jgi:hypothetical protein
MRNGSATESLISANHALADYREQIFKTTVYRQSNFARDQYDATPELDPIRLNRIMLRIFPLSMTLSENRFPLFRIML